MTLEDFINRYLQDPEFRDSDASEEELENFIRDAWAFKLNLTPAEGGMTQEEYNFQTTDKMISILNALRYWHAAYSQYDGYTAPTASDVGWEGQSQWHENWRNDNLTGDYETDVVPFITTKIDDGTGGGTAVGEPGLPGSIKEYYSRQKEAQPEAVFQRYLEDQPYTGLSQTARGYMGGLGERAATQYWTSPTLRGPTFAPEDTMREDPITTTQSFRDFLRKGEVGQAGGGMVDGVRTFMRPGQMLGRLQDIGSRIMAPTEYNAAGEVIPPTRPLTGPESFLQERMGISTPEEQRGMVAEPLMAGVSSYPGMREALYRMMGRRIRKQEEDDPGTPFLRWWSQQANPFGWS